MARCRRFRRDGRAKWSYGTNSYGLCGRGLLGRGLYVHILYGHGLHGYGPCGYGPYGNGPCSHGQTSSGAIWSYGTYSYGLYGYGPRSRGQPSGVAVCGCVGAAARFVVATGDRHEHAVPGHSAHHLGHVLWQSQKSFWCVFKYSRRVPTANAEDPCRSEGSPKTRLAKTFPTPPPRLDPALDENRP